MHLAIHRGMTNRNLLTIVLLLLLPAVVHADGQKPETNVNERYEVESVQVSGINQSRISKDLNDDMQKLVGQKYNQQAAQDLAERLRQELKDHNVKLTVRRGDQAERVKVIFEVERDRGKQFSVAIASLIYNSKLGWSGDLDLPFDYHHSSFVFGLVNSAEDLLERNAGFRLHYENRKVGTDLLQLRLEFAGYHQKWNPATENALADSPGVPGVYRARQDFAPSVSILPLPEVKLTAGLSFQRIQTQYPSVHTETAYAATGGIQFRRRLRDGGFRHELSADYGVRTATRALDSDFVYTRHSWSAGYAASRGRNRFGARIQAGLITGSAPLFERFSLGNSSALRGWNKFDVAPLGGDRAVHGSLEYRYRPFEFFYDFGAVWDQGQPARARHGLGFGLATRNGFFMSLAFPVRLNRVTPVFMIGFRD